MEFISIICLVTTLYTVQVGANLPVYRVVAVAWSVLNKWVLY